MIIINTMKNKTEVFHQLIDKKILEVQLEMKKNTDPAMRKMVFLPQNNINPHKICELEKDIYK
jgi:hypothetical protein